MYYKKSKNIGITIIFTLFSAYCILPVIFILAASLSEENLLKRSGYSLIPRGFSMSAYEYIFKSPDSILRAYGITILVTLAGTAASLLLTTMLAYAIARKDFKFGRILAMLVFFALLFRAGMIPTYITMVRYYAMKNTLFALIVPYIIIPWHVFLMKSFLADVPVELIESAKIDGGGEMIIFWRIVMPISKPALATVGLFIAFTYWTDWYQSMLYIDRQQLTNLQFYLYRIMNNIQYLSTAMFTVDIDMSKMPSETTRMALCVLAAGPMLVVFPFFQKHFVKGLTVGAVKG